MKLVKNISNKIIKTLKISAISTVFGGFVVFGGLGLNVYANNNDFPLIDDDETPAIHEFVTNVNLNLRSGPSTDFDRIVLLPAGTIMIVNEFVPDGFSYVTVTINGVTYSGFVSSEFIAPFNSASAQAAVQSASQTIVQMNGNVELLSWTEVRAIMPTGTNIQIYDILSGTTYFVRNWSNGNHADVDPLTMQDTEIMRATFNGVWTWDPRPVLVTINGRTIAAAINGMPHGGSMIANNGVTGHFCLHFFGSTTHNGNRAYERQMQEAVMRAFNSQN